MFLSRDLYIIKNAPMTFNVSDSRPFFQLNNVHSQLELIPWMDSVCLVLNLFNPILFVDGGHSSNQSHGRIQFVSLSQRQCPEMMKCK